MKLTIKINKEVVGEYELGPNDDLSLDVKQVESSPYKNFSEKEELMFDAFRKIYPGKKRGLTTEFKTFRKKHKDDWRDELHKLYPSVLLEIQHKKKLKDGGRFCPEWKNLQTWVNNRCWEIDYNERPVQPPPIDFKIAFKKVD